MERDGSQPEIVFGELVRPYEGPRATVFQKDLDRDARIRALEASAAADRLTHRAELTERTDDFESQLRAERDQLRALLEKLTCELADTESCAA
ncbi:hypothetical protein [Kitasatospora griseola]|uniref:hypothetical protein n=1 Tax=Kitasatospora griseola TaxID=2064 RepID=UPI0037F44CFA